MPYTYRKNERLRKNREFIETMKGKRLSIDGLSLFYTKNDASGFRVGVSVSKKLANAVRRNRLKRQIRACIMRSLRDKEAGYDLVFVVRRELSSAGFERVRNAVQTALERSGIIRPAREAAAP